MSIVYRQRDGRGPKTLVAVLTLLSFLVVWILGTGLNRNALVIACMCLMTSALLGWMDWIRRQEISEFTAAGNLVIRRRGWFARPTTSTFELDQFGEIRSYLTAGADPINRLELVTVSGGEAVLIATRLPGSAHSSFWSLAGQSLENPEIRNLRTELALEWALTDVGFQGVKWVGKLIEGGE